MSQGAILYISFFGVKKCDIGHESTCFLVVFHLISVGCLGPYAHQINIVRTKQEEGNDHGTNIML